MWLDVCAETCYTKGMDNAPNTEKRFMMTEQIWTREITVYGALCKVTKFADGTYSGSVLKECDWDEYYWRTFTPNPAIIDAAERNEAPW